jgi:hypothetical protein
MERRLDSLDKSIDNLLGGLAVPPASLCSPADLDEQHKSTLDISSMPSNAARSLSEASVASRPADTNPIPDVNGTDDQQKKSAANDEKRKDWIDSVSSTATGRLGCLRFGRVWILVYVQPREEGYVQKISWITITLVNATIDKCCEFRTPIQVRLEDGSLQFPWFPKRCQTQLQSIDAFDSMAEALDSRLEPNLPMFHYYQSRQIRATWYR